METAHLSICVVFGDILFSDFATGFRNRGAVEASSLPADVDRFLLTVDHVLFDIALVGHGFTNWKKSKFKIESFSEYLIGDTNHQKMQHYCAGFLSYKPLIFRCNNCSRRKQLSTKELFSNLNLTNNDTLVGK